MLGSNELLCSTCRCNSDNQSLSRKPKRALSAYNVFFKYQREHILSVAPRKSVGFASLARCVASRWKQLGAAERKQFEEIAKEEKERYKREMEQWKKEYRKLEVCHAGACTCVKPAKAQNMVKQGGSPTDTSQTPEQSLSFDMHFRNAVARTSLHHSNANTCNPVLPLSVQSRGNNFATPQIHTLQRRTNGASQERSTSTSLSILFSKLDDDCLDILSSFDWTDMN